MDREVLYEKVTFEQRLGLSDKADMERIGRRDFWAEGKQVYQGMSMSEDNQQVHVG